ncbi:HtaA domain-containing protein [Arthrobacter sp. AZCC_0090]|uniref:HtaA domain-containing protein n=1 Tax=Arthrobacter sp. AZCC_0090 TaxID=2735881 RepID=UPI0016212B41|nr:HtaA domain-containing protein [Arthrobacter sp. AZCC_0090]MBB6407189.1 hypothetical protein [Arthrobacter sp. AZCC_0090]
MYLESPTTSGDLSWNVYSRFRDYVRSIPDGTEEWLRGDGRIEQQAVVFHLDPASSYDPDRGTGVIRFHGSIRFRGYRGMLHVTISDPWVEVTSGHMVLSVDSSSSGAPTRVVFAEAIPTKPVRTGEGLRWSGVPAALTDDGSGLLGNVYPVGTDLDPFDFWIPSEQP